MTRYGRRQFLGGIAGGTLAMGLARPTAAQATPVVAMGNNYFDPIGLFVEPGTTVRFDLEAGAHSATAYADRIPSDADAFDSGTISSGSFEHTFETPGTYDYYCIPHRSVGMVGRIVVGSPGGPAEEDPVSDGDVPPSETIVEREAVPYGDWTDGEETGGGMMHHGDDPGMMSGRSGRASWGLPYVGGTLGLLGVGGGALYWALGGDAESTGTDPDAMEALRQEYANGAIDEEEFHRRRKRLSSDGGNGPD